MNTPTITQTGALRSLHLSPQPRRRTLAAVIHRHSMAITALCAALTGFLIGRLASPECASPVLHVAGFLTALTATMGSLWFTLCTAPARSNVTPDATGDLRPDFVHHDGTAARDL